MQGIVFTVIGRLRAAGPRLRGESGQGLVEYALIIAIVSLGAIASLTFLKGSISDLFNKAGNSINAVAVGADGSGGGGGGGGGPTPGTVTLAQLGGQGSNPSFLMTATSVGWTGVGSGTPYTYTWEQGNIAGVGAPTNCAGLTWSAFGAAAAGGATNTRAPFDDTSGSGNGNSGDRCYRVTVVATGPGGSSSPVTSGALFVNNV